MHPVASDESSEACAGEGVRGQWVAQHLILLFPRRKSQAEGEPACRDPPMVSLIYLFWTAFQIPATNMLKLDISLTSYIVSTWGLLFPLHDLRKAACGWIIGT